MIDNNDINNVKFLYERVPDEMKQASVSFKQSWELARALSKNQFGDALGLLKQAVKLDQTQNALRDSIGILRSILVWHLTEHTVPDFISSAYSNIEFAKVKEMLGNPANLNQILSKTTFLASAAADAQGFIQVNQRS